MKIRIKGNSVRYRLTKPEVEFFITGGLIREETCFPGKTLTYVLQQTDSEALSATFTGDIITIYMPAPMAAELAATNRVGFETMDSELTISVEKDFKCLDNVAEDQSDNYPNPLALYVHEQN